MRGEIYGLDAYEINHRNAWKDELSAIMREYKVKWMQRAKEKYPKPNECNTKYFMSKVSSKIEKT
jgi:hypothetical protein